MTFKRLSILLICLLGSLALAQAPLRVLVLPFDASEAADNYGLGLAVGIQRGLNTLEGVYVPPVGDGALVASRAAALGGDLTGTVAGLFDADALVSGAVSLTDDGLRVTLAFSGPRFPQGEQTTFDVPAVSSTVVRTINEEVVARLGLSVDGTVQARLDAVASQAPTVFSLGPVGVAASRLGSSATELAGAIELDGNSSWVHSEYARALMLSGNADGALSASQRALELNPTDIEAMVDHGIILSQFGRTDEAIAQYDQALQINSWHAMALAGRALLSGSPSEALAGFDRAVTAYPRLSEAWLDMVALTNDNARALQLLRRAAGYLPESVQIHRSFTLRTIAAGDADGALNYLRQVASDQLAATPTLYSLAIHLPASHTPQAIEFARQGATAFPDSTIPGLTEAHLLRRADRISEAEALLRNLNTAHPQDVEVTNQLAITVAAAGRVGEAQQLFESISGSSPVVQLNLAQALLEDGQAQAALQVLQPLAAAAGADADTLTLYGDALARTGDRQAAEIAYLNALAADPNWTPANVGLTRLGEQAQVTGGQSFTMPAAAAAPFERGLTALNSGDTTTAIIEFTAASDNNGGALADFYLGYSLQVSGRERDAIPAYEAALAELPESDIILNNLGYSQLTLGRYDLALPLLRRAIAANDDNAQAHMNLGLTYFGLSRYGDAVASWERSTALQPDLAATLEDLIQEARSRTGQ